MTKQMKRWMDIVLGSRDFFEILSRETNEIYDLIQPLLDSHGRARSFETGKDYILDDDGTPLIIGYDDIDEWIDSNLF